MKTWWQTHPDYQRMWRKTEKGRAVGVIWSARRRARKCFAPAAFTQAEWQAIKAAYLNRCAYCHVLSKRLTQDHMMPLALGGHHTADNIVPACWSCNNRKQTKSWMMFHPLYRGGEVAA